MIHRDLLCRWGGCIVSGPVCRTEIKAQGYIAGWRRSSVQCKAPAYMPWPIGTCLLRGSCGKANRSIAQDITQGFDRCQSATAAVISDHRKVAASAEKAGTACRGIGWYCTGIYHYNCTVTRVCTSAVRQCHTIRPGFAQQSSRKIEGVGEGVVGYRTAIMQPLVALRIGALHF
ncbi:hypothetical protein D3C80_1592830 [compost metagenome]